MAEQKALHRPMRTFYVDGRCSSLEKAYGPYPAFWQDLATWPGWRPTRKAFLKFQDTGTSSEIRNMTKRLGEYPPKKEEAIPEMKEEDVDEAEMVRELYEPMRQWYLTQAGLQKVHGAFPPNPETMRHWTAFKIVTSAFLDSDSPSEKQTGLTKKPSRFGDATGNRRKRPRHLNGSTQLVLVRPHQKKKKKTKTNKQNSAV